MKINLTQKICKDWCPVDFSQNQQAALANFLCEIDFQVFSYKKWTLILSAKQLFNNYKLFCNRIYELIKLIFSNRYSMQFHMLFSLDWAFSDNKSKLIIMTYKIPDFLLISYFWACSVFCRAPPSTYNMYIITF